MNSLRIATRESALALWQANHVKALLEAAQEGLRCEIVGMTTEGDRNKVSPLSQMGGKGVFVKELETGLIDGSVDIAVHSMKDVPAEMPAGLDITAICERADPRDAFVSNNYRGLDALPEGSIVGSSSLRRVLQVKAVYPGLEFRELRGNVDTRLRKLDEGNYDAIILAVAGLSRLGLVERITQEIDETISIPAAGQGAVGIESRLDDERTNSLLAAINHEETWTRVTAERRVTQSLGATCNLPVAVYANIAVEEIRLRAFVSDLAGSEIIREEVTGDAGAAMELAALLGDRLLAAGAARLIN